MHDFNGIEIKKGDLLDSVKAMYKEKRRLVMINGYINENKENVIAYNFSNETRSTNPTRNTCNT